MSEENKHTNGPLPFGSTANHTPFPAVAEMVQQRLTELLQMTADGQASDVASQLERARQNAVAAISGVIKANSVLSREGSDRIAALVCGELERSWILIEMPPEGHSSEPQV